MPPENNIIHAKGIGKLYKLYHQAVSGPIKEFLFPWRRDQFYKSFWAVQDVDLKIRKGEIVGVIGPNGSGKTTLLKMIAGLLPVDRGTLSVQGRVTALLALGVGVHPEFSGLENAYFNGLLLGMRREEIKSKMGEIIEFAEIGEFIHQPFRTYSAGMKARLLFAVAMSVRPEILIVDEALATGDAYFLNKSKQKIKEICESGATVLFVSHNMEQIEELCSRAFLIVKGKIKKTGKPCEVIRHYNEHCLSVKENKQRKKKGGRFSLFDGSGEVQIKNITLLDQKEKRRSTFRSGDKVIIRITFRKTLQTPSTLRVWIGFIDSETEKWVTEIGSKTAEKNLPVHYGWSGGHKYVFREKNTTLDFILNPLQIQYGDFKLWITAVDDKKNVIFEYKDIISLKVGGRIQSIHNPSAKFWHSYKMKKETR
jgi:ABC-type branched-subunit amino acid transport system ATPase component